MSPTAIVRVGGGGSLPVPRTLRGVDEAGDSGGVPSSFTANVPRRIGSGGAPGNGEGSKVTRGRGGGRGGDAKGERAGNGSLSLEVRLEWTDESKLDDDEFEDVGRRVAFRGGSAGGGLTVNDGGDMTSSGEWVYSGEWILGTSLS